MEIPQELAQKIIDKVGEEKAAAFVQQALEKSLEDESFTSDDEEAVKERLRNLGYLE